MKIIIELDMHELAFLMAQKATGKKLDESTQNDLREEIEEEILARVKELEKAQEDNLGDDKKDTRHGGGGDYE